MQPIEPIQLMRRADNVRQIINNQQWAGPNARPAKRRVGVPGGQQSGRRFELMGPVLRVGGVEGEPVDWAAAAEGAREGETVATRKSVCGRVLVTKVWAVSSSTCMYWLLEFCRKTFAHSKECAFCAQERLCVFWADFSAQRAAKEQPKQSQNKEA